MTSAKSAVQRFDFKSILRSSDLVMAIGVISIVGLMLLPLPGVAVDFLVVLNLAVSLGIILLSLYISKAIDFSVFPSLLLLITLFRLGLNVSISRLILTSGNAGSVIDVLGTMVVGGNYVVGIVIFIIIMVIQFTVITNGAGRVAEVAARFTLDAMPGKQMAIDADLNAGTIDEDTARKRRLEVQSEANFYGAMDGASKFVRGDAMAAVIITIVNILGGIVIGLLQRNLSIMDALQNYALVTVGAGLAIQVPALLISSAAGLIVTRSAGEASMGSSMLKQLSNYETMVAGAVIIGVIGLVPGIPKIPFLAVAALMGFVAYRIRQAKNKAERAAKEKEAAVISKPPAETQEDMMSMAIVDPLELEVGYGLIPLVDEERADNLLNQITNIRRQLLTEMGFVLPVVRIRDNLRLTPQTYRIKIRGEEIARGELYVDRYLAIPGAEIDESIRGVPTTEPAFGLPALWISEAEKGRAEVAGYTVVSPLAALSTHLTEILRSNAAVLLSRQMLQEMVAQLRRKSPAAVEGLVPELLNIGDLQDVLRNLLRERVPIRDLGGILEILSKHVGVTRDANILAEAVRQTMSLTLSNMYKDDDGFLHVFTLSPTLERTLRGALSSAEGGLGFQIETDLAQAILTATGKNMEQMAQGGFLPILLCPRELRLAFRRLIEPAFPNLVVMAFSEISPGTKVKAHGMVDVEQNK